MPIQAAKTARIAVKTRAMTGKLFNLNYGRFSTDNPAVPEAEEEEKIIGDAKSEPGSKDSVKSQAGIEQTVIALLAQQN
jgi:hypothetical protein